MAYWGIALTLLHQPVRRAAGRQSAARAGGDREGQGGRRQDAARARLHRRARRLVHRIRQGRSPQPRAGLFQGDGGGGGALSPGRRGADRTTRWRSKVAASPADKTYANQLKGAAILEADFQAPAAASRRRPLSDPRLRLSADRREGPRRRHALRRDRAGCAACPAHAVPHLHPRRLLEGVDRRQPRLGARGQGRQGVRRPAARPGLHGLRLSAARAGQECPGRHRRR